MSTTPPPIDGVETKQAADGGERLSMSLEGEIASSRSSISLSGSAWSIPVDFDASYYESEANVAKIVKIQAFLRRVSVQQHYNLIRT